jgi:UDP-N-acetylglucosamine--N-acetylmuramyl-(pentapeptide) pyrophosphoryl-undecaprenol N-acetylglucosamine transferase
MKIIVSAGGTGGHIYPALAIINKIKEHDKNADFLYIGTTTRMEKDIIPEHNIKYIGLDTYGLQRKITLKNIKAFFKYLSAIKESKKIIKEYKPDIVIGCGGYVMAPVIYAAKKCGCKTLIHEQNSILGLSNKMMLKYTDTLCTSFKSMKIDGVNCVYTGNPQGDSVHNLVPYSKRKFGLSDNKKLVLIVMGSLGSKTVNEVLKSSLNKFDSSYEVLIVTGKDYYEDYKQIKRNSNVFIEPFIDNLNRLFSKTDLLVSRAGATTISELIGTNTPTIFIPSPYVTENHQYKNAMDLVNNGAGKIIEEKDLTSETK